MVVMFPGDAQVNVQVERIKREQGGIGLLIDEFYGVRAMLALVQVDVLVPDLIGQAYLAVRLGYHVPGQATHGALTQPEGEVQRLVELVAEVIGRTHLCRYQFLVIIAQAHARLDGVFGIFLVHEFARCGVVDVAQADDAVIGLVVVGHTNHSLEYHDGVNLGPCRFLAAPDQLLDGRAVEMGR